MFEEINQIVKNKKEPNITKTTKTDLSESLLNIKFWDSKLNAENIKIFTTKLSQFYEQKNLQHNQSLENYSFYDTRNTFYLNKVTSSNFFNNQKVCINKNDLKIQTNEKQFSSNNFYSNQIFPSSPTSPKKKVKKSDEDHKVINLERVFIFFFNIKFIF